MRTKSTKGRFVLAAWLLISAALPPAAGDTPHGFTLRAGSHTFRSGDYEGRFIALHFLLKTECPYCAQLVADYVENGPRMADVTHVFIKPDSDEEIAAWSKKISATGIDTVIYRDPDAKLAKEFRIPDGYLFHGESMHFPALIVLGPDGREVFRHVSAGNTDRMTFEAFAERIMPLLRSEETAHLHLGKGGLALRGYDPVSYFRGGPQPGSEERISRFRGAAYRFASDENRRAFAENPLKYAPQYGGWCATAMADGGRKVEIDPMNYKITNDRLFLFYKGWLGDALKDWNKDEAALTRRADAQWSRLVPGSAPRR